MRAIKGFQHYLHTVFLSMKIHYKKYWPDRTLSTSELPITIDTWIWRKRTLNALIRMIFFLTWGEVSVVRFCVHQWCTKQRFSDLICLCHPMHSIKKYTDIPIIQFQCTHCDNRYPTPLCVMQCCSAFKTLWYTIDLPSFDKIPCCSNKKLYGGTLIWSASTRANILR